VQLAIAKTLPIFGTFWVANLVRTSSLKAPEVAGDMVPRAVIISAAVPGKVGFSSQWAVSTGKRLQPAKSDAWHMVAAFSNDNSSHKDHCLTFDASAGSFS